MTAQRYLKPVRTQRFATSPVAATIEVCDTPRAAIRHDLQVPGVVSREAGEAVHAIAH
ncbi:hypothetical protein ACLQ24_23740 [Micromonospora sp. DT4]|uniref:hypothetical protein n=1 Tax=Micromonospora sp. DT4 TaxID=3393438 RepID=UPI003CF7A58F